MKIKTHTIEPWLIANQHVRYNLGESGIQDQTLGDLLETVGCSVGPLENVSLANSDTRGDSELRAEIARLYDGAAPENVLVTTGVSEGLFLYYSIRSRKNANIIVPVPAFESLYTLPEYLGFELRKVKLRREERFRPNLDEIERCADKNTDVIVINNPHNPTGVMYTADEIRRIRRIAEHCDAEIVADEHYRFLPLTTSGSVLPSIYDGRADIVAFGSMIKCFGCVGLRIGWIVSANADLLAALRDLKDYTTHTACRINETVATWLLRHGDAMAKLHRSWVQRNVSAFAKVVERFGVFAWHPPEAGIVAFPWLLDSRLSSSLLATQMAKAKGVFLLPGDAFDCPGHFRLGFGLKPDRFEEAMASLSDEIRRW